MQDHSRINVREGLDALHKLLENPDDTEQAFRVIRSLDGHALDRIVARMKADPEGRALLAARPSLLAALQDRAALAAVPDGSLGRAYLAFCEREGIEPGGLVEASTSTDDCFESDEELRYVAHRMRDSHDLWHVVTGHHTDLAGELSILAFTAAQAPNAGISLLVTAGYLRTFQFWGGVGATGRRMVREAFARGRRARWLPAVPWEAWLARPLEDVRVDLELGGVPVYRPFYARDLEALAA